MKALLKCCLLLALIIGAKLAKQPAPAQVVAAPTSAPARVTNDIVLVHQVLTSEPVPTRSTTMLNDWMREPDTATISAF